MMNAAEAKARVCIEYMSAVEPAPTARQGAPAAPAKNRQTSKLANDLLKPAPSVNSMKTGAVIFCK